MGDGDIREAVSIEIAETRAFDTVEPADRDDGPRFRGVLMARMEHDDDFSGILEIRDVISQSVFVHVSGIKSVAKTRVVVNLKALPSVFGMSGGEEKCEK